VTLFLFSLISKRGGVLADRFFGFWVREGIPVPLFVSLVRSFPFLRAEGDATEAEG